MNGYLTFLRSLTPYQQRAEIGRLAFIGGVFNCAVEEDILKDQTVVAFSEMLGVDPRFWEFDLKHYAEEPDLFRAPMFRDDQCAAPFSFRYVHSNHNLVVTGIIYIDDDESSMIGRLTCSTGEEKSRSRDRLVLAGIDPDTPKVLSHDVEIWRKIPYLDYLKRLMPQQRCEAIFDLAELAWGIYNPKFLDHSELAFELQKLGIWDLGGAEPFPRSGQSSLTEGDAPSR